MTAELTVAPTRTGLESLSPAQRDAAVTAYLVDARDRLHLALEATGPEAVKALKAEVSVVAEMSRQVNVSKEIQTDAQEMVRRAEFALGKAIRAGQERGEISDRSSGARLGALRREAARRGEQVDEDSISLVRGKDFLAPGLEQVETYALADATPEQFEEALADARAEGNVSRANVVRKVKERTHAEQFADKWERVEQLAGKGWSSEQIAEEVGMSVGGLRSGARREGIKFPADIYTSRRRKADATEVIRRTVSSLEGMCMGLRFINLDDIEDTGEAQEWVDSLTTSISTLSKVKRQIRESIS